MELLKPVFAVMLILVVLLSLVACGEKSSNESQVSDMSKVVETSQTQSTAVETSNKLLEIHPLYKDEVEDTKQKLKQVQTRSGFSYLFISDTHIDYTGGIKHERPVVLREIAAVIDIANSCDVDCVILGGDLIHGISSKQSSMEDLQMFAEMFSNCKMPVYAVRGNHDLNDYHGRPSPLEYIITQEEWVDTLVTPLSKSNPVVHDPKNPKSTYYYVDFPEKNVRLITLDPYNYPVTSSDGEICDHHNEDWNHVDEGQLDWFASVALSSQNDGWQYFVASHGPIIGSEGFGRKDQVRAVISAFNNGLEYTLSDGTVVDYKNCTSYVPLNISGHTHVNAFKYDDDAKFLSVVTGSGKVSYYPQNVEYYANRYDADWVYHPLREFDTVTEATFDAVSVNPDGSVYRIAFGAGEDNNLWISNYRK